MRAASWLGIAFTALLIIATEFATHLTEAPEDLGVILFLLALAPIAYAGLRAGLPHGLAAAGLLTIYSMHFVGPHDVVLSTTPEAWQAALIVGVLGVGMAWPMSRVKRREDRLRLALEERARDLEAKNLELTEANASLEAFGYVVSHDLKEPVRALENYLDAARQEWPAPAAKDLVERAYAANARLTHLLHGLLDYSRTSSLLASTRPVDVRTTVLSDAWRARYAPIAEERKAHVEVDEKIPQVLGDEVILAQLLGNLILNAIRHNPKPEPRVMIRGEAREGGRVEIFVEDDGPGFPPDVLDRFSHLRGNRPATIKSGFGLAIAHRAAQRLGGTMRIEDRPGGLGGRVRIDLPAA